MSNPTVPTALINDSTICLNETKTSLQIIEYHMMHIHFLPISHIGYVVISSILSDNLSAISETSSAESVRSAMTGSGPASFNLATKCTISNV